MIKEWSLKAIRNDMGITQKEMAEKLNIPYTTYVSKEQGRSPLTLEEAKKIADLAKISVNLIRC